jgi:fatty-acyl-CoA synthase
MYGDKIGVIDGDRRFTYAEFGRRTHRLANALLQLGLQPNDRVAYLAYNSYPLLEGYFGVLEAHGVLMPINIRLTADEIAYILETSAARILLADGDFVALVQKVVTNLHTPPTIVWLTDVPEGRNEALYDDLLAAASSDPPPTFDIDENEVVELFFTSGTTGLPKGVMLTNRNLYMHSLSVLSSFPTDGNTIQLHTIPLFHVNGWGIPQYLTAVGGVHVMMRRFDPAEVLRLVQSETITRFFAVPTMLNMIISCEDIDRFDLSSLEVVTTGGAPTPPEMIRRAEKVLGCKIRSGYGLSETSPVLSIAVDKAGAVQKASEDTIGLQASAGLPLLGVELGILDENGCRLPHDGDHSGEVVARGNCVMEGYWQDPDATSASIRDGWLLTGDMGRIDRDGYLHIVDRKKDIIISGGENISSVDIEKALCEHPAVLEAAVVAVPDETWGEVPKALVALRPGMQANEQELMEFCRGSLANFKIPKSIEFRDSLPKGGTGKILKSQLREPYWQGRQTRIH